MVVEMKLSEGYKETKVGVIPKDWEVQEMGVIGETIIGLTYKPENVKPYGLLVLRSSNILESKLEFSDEVFVDVKVKEKLIVKEDDLLICVRNGSRNLIGKCALISKDAVGSTFGAFMSLYRSSKSRYLFQYFQSYIIKNQINENMGATINQITNKNLNSFLVGIPSDEKEERLIINVLTDTDDLITSLEKLIDKKKKIKQGTMQQLLTGKKRLPGFSGEWEVKKLGDLGEILTGNTPPTNNKNNYGNEYMFVSPFDLGYGKYIYSTEKGLSKEGFKIARKYPKNSILITCIGSTIGKIGISTEEVSSNQQINAILPNDTFETSYIYYILSLFAQKIKAMASEQAVPIINKTTFKSIDILLPDIKEQKAIAQILSDMDSEIELLEQKLSKYKTIKQGMMQELLTGRIRLI